MKADPSDRGEDVSMMEPLRLAEASRHRPELNDLAITLAGKAGGLRKSLPAPVATALAHMVRAMNCYYSNLIEGHDTHPVEIERALKGDYSKDKKKRDLQQEAKAHIEIQRWIDEGGLGRHPARVSAMRDIHRRFCSLLPDDLLWVIDPVTHRRLKVVPGELRQRDVAVGAHRPVSPAALPRFLARFEEIYAPLGVSETVVCAAAAHHRLLWIHPFLDGNGRVARLVSHAMLLAALDTGALWSIARGLARNVGEYKRLLAECDLHRRNDLDGRGNLSEEALAQFTRFFLGLCVDQVVFMEKLMRPAELRGRMIAWAEGEAARGNLPARSAAVLDALLHRGELPRSEVAGIVATGERQARRVVAALTDRGVMTSETTRAPLKLQFPAVLALQWMPGLFPEA